MTIAIIGTGGIGSAIARQLASGGETLRLSSADEESARRLAAVIGEAAVVAVDNHDALPGADAVVLALRFGVLKGVIDEIAEPLTGKLVVVPSNPVGIDTRGNLVRLLPKEQSSGKSLPPSPLQHYWSLSVEEQFYLVWPWLLLGLLLLIGLRQRFWRDEHTRLVAGVAIAVICSKRAPASRGGRCCR